MRENASGEKHYSDSDWVSLWRISHKPGRAWLAVFGPIALIAATYIVLTNFGQQFGFAIFFYLVGIPAVLVLAFDRPVKVTARGVILPWEASGPIKRFLPFDGNVQAIIRPVESRKFVLFLRGLDPMEPLDLASPRCLTSFSISDLGNPDTFLDALKAYVPVREVTRSKWD